MSPATVLEAESCRHERVVSVAGLPFDAVTMREALSRVEGMIASGRPHQVVTANVQFAVRAMSDPELHRIICGASLVVCDGMPLTWASRILDTPLPERVAGVDLTIALLQRASERGYRVFFLGGAPGITRRAVANVCRRFPNLNIVGHYSPPLTTLEEMDHEEIRRRVSVAQPDLLFVCFGCPKSEKWIARYSAECGVPVAIGVGGTIDLLAQRVKRAPQWMQRSGLEWLFRILQEPKRLFARYAKDVTPILHAVTAEWLALRLLPACQIMRQRAWFANGGGMRQHTEALECVTSESSEAEARSNYTRIELKGWLSAATLRHCSAFARMPASWLGRHVLLRLSDVASIDSSGAAFLLSMHRQLTQAGHALILVSPSKAVARALRVSRLDQVLSVSPCEETACLSLAETHRPAYPLGSVPLDDRPSMRWERSAFRRFLKSVASACSRATVGRLRAPAT